MFAFGAISELMEQKSGNRNLGQESGNRNLETEIWDRNLETGIWKQESGNRNLETGIRCYQALSDLIKQIRKQEVKGTFAHGTATTLKYRTMKL
jgi:hypothetical protein